MAEYANLRLEQGDDGVALVTINRPDVHNALDGTTTAELRAALDRLAADPALRVVIVTGAGEKAFAAGADIRHLQRRTALEVLAGDLQDALNRLEELPVPVIAAVNGFALGGGCELALACDLRVAAANASFGQPEVNLGILAGGGGTQRLARLIGPGRAKELLFTGARIDAEEALRLGLVNRIVPAGQAVAGARELAAAILRKAPVAVRLSKLACQIGGSVDLRNGLLVERLAQAVLYGTEDKAEGVNAFLEKRPPEFRGR